MHFVSRPNTVRYDRSLRILVVARARKNRNDGYKHRVVSTVQELVEQGHLVRLLCFYPLTDIIGKKGFPAPRERLRTILIPSLPTSTSRILSSVSRAIAETVTRLVGAVYRFDAVQGEGALCAVIARKLRVPLFVVDFHGDSVEEEKMRGAPDWRIRLTMNDERVALKRANAIVAASEPLRKTMVERHADPGVLSVTAPCGADLERFAASDAERERARRELKVEGRTVFCYLGGSSRWQCIDETLDLIVQSRRLDPRIFFLFLTPDNIHALRGKLRGIGEPERDYRCLSLSRDEVPRVLPAADVGVLLRRESPVNAVASPTKCGEYLAAGVPVLATEHAGDAANVLRQGNCGFLLSDVSCDSTEIERILQFASRVVSDRATWAKRCREAARKYQSWNVASEALKRIYRAA